MQPQLADWIKIKSLLALFLTVHRNSYCDGYQKDNNESTDINYQLDYNHDTISVWQFLAFNSSFDNFNNCTKLMSQPLSPNSTCSYVQAMCKGKVKLINYMSFALCNLEQYQVGPL